MFTKMCMLMVQFACIISNKSVLSIVSTTVQPLQGPQGTETGIHISFFSNSSTGQVHQKRYLP